MLAMIKVNGKNYKTIGDAAKAFHVSAKTFHEWIQKKIVDRPPEVEYGVRIIMHFPPTYMKKAKSQVEKYRSQKSGKRNG